MQPLPLSYFKTFLLVYQKTPYSMSIHFLLLPPTPEMINLSNLSSFIFCLYEFTYLGICVCVCIYAYIWNYKMYSIIYTHTHMWDHALYKLLCLSHTFYTHWTTCLYLITFFIIFHGMYTLLQ